MVSHLVPQPRSAPDWRSCLYRYLRPFVAGARVLEIGSGASDPEGAQQLAELGALSVVTTLVGAQAAAGVVSRPNASAASLAADGPFDVIVLTDGAGLLDGTFWLPFDALTALLAPNGVVAVAAQSADTDAPAPGSVAYDDLMEGLENHFQFVRSFGQTRFSAWGLAEFDAEALEFEIDSGLVDPQSEAPDYYLAIAGNGNPGAALGFSLIQTPVPSSGLASDPSAAREEAVPEMRARPAEHTIDTESGTAGGAAAHDQGTSDQLESLRKQLEDKERTCVEALRKLTDLEGKSAGLIRVARAQGEELEELRARLRRAAEMRKELDEEVARLRHALSAADESVLSLTRKAADEMSALAAQLTQGLRAPVAAEPGPPEVSANSRAREQLLVRRESEIAERDERIAQLELEKQDLLWQLQAAQASALSAAPEAAPPADVDPEVSNGQSDEALAGYQRAAQLHLKEAEALQAALLEQEARVIELENQLGRALEVADKARHETEKLKASLRASEASERSRRSRLAELEGAVLRMKHAQRVPEKPAAQSSAELDALRAELAQHQSAQADLSARLEVTQGALVRSEQSCESLRAQNGAAQERITELEEAAAAAEKAQRAAERDLDLARAGAEPDASEQSVALEQERRSEAIRQVAEEDVARLREALDRSDDQLRQARGQLMPLRGKIHELEREATVRLDAERALFAHMLEEVSALHEGLQREAAEVAELAKAQSSLAGDPAPGSSSDPADSV